MQTKPAINHDHSQTYAQATYLLLVKNQYSGANANTHVFTLHQTPPNSSKASEIKRAECASVVMPRGT